MTNELTLLLKLELKVNLSVPNFYQWFSDLNNYPKIFPHVYEIKPVNTGALKPGNEYIEYAKNFFGKKEKLTVKITKVIEEEQVWAEADNPRVRSVFCFTFKRLGSKTLFTIRFFSKHQNILILLLLKIGMYILFSPRRIIAQRRLKKIFPANE